MANKIELKITVSEGFQPYIQGMADKLGLTVENTITLALARLDYELKKPYNPQLEADANQIKGFFS